MADKTIPVRAPEGTRWVLDRHDLMLVKEANVDEQGRVFRDKKVFARTKREYLSRLDRFDKNSPILDVTSVYDGDVREASKEILSSVHAAQVSKSNMARAARSIAKNPRGI